MVRTAPPPGFRAFAWGAGDTLWGIVHGRLAAAVPDGTVMRFHDIAWDVQASGAGPVSWTNERGLIVRRGSATDTIGRPGPLGSEYTGPEVLWSPSGARALLTWTAEAGTRHTVLEAGSHRVLEARLSGYAAGAPALWLDESRALLPVTAFAPLSGPGGYREAGYRTDIALLDVTADSIVRVTAVEDGDFLVLEGMLHDDTVLVGIRHGDATPVRHLTLDTRAWRLHSRLDRPGRAMAAYGIIALLPPDTVPGGEWEWDLLMVEDGMHAVASGAGYAIRLLWHPGARRLAVSQDSEASSGYVTVIVEARASQ